jgi:hypothetical protein
MTWRWCLAIIDINCWYDGIDDYWYLLVTDIITWLLLLADDIILRLALFIIDNIIIGSDCTWWRIIGNGDDVISRSIIDAVTVDVCALKCGTLMSIHFGWWLFDTYGNIIIDDILTLMAILTVRDLLLHCNDWYVNIYYWGCGISVHIDVVIWYLSYLLFCDDDDILLKLLMIRDSILMMMMMRWLLFLICLFWRVVVCCMLFWWVLFDIIDNAAVATTTY